LGGSQLKWIRLGDPQFVGFGIRFRSDWSGDKTTVGARNALEQAIAIYRAPFEADNAGVEEDLLVHPPQQTRGFEMLRMAVRQAFGQRPQDVRSSRRLAGLDEALGVETPVLRIVNTWHGVNLVALLTRARSLGLAFEPDLKPREVAKAVVRALQATPPEKRDEWYLPTLAEANLGLGDYDAVERTIHEYAANDDAKPFLIASTLRQFTEVWDLEAKGRRGKGIVAALRARLASWEMTGGEIRNLRAQRAPDAGQLEAILGDKGVKTYRWWKTGLDRAVAIAAVRQQFGTRIGTGFLVRARDIGIEPGDELLVMTNFHVVNEHGASNGIAPEQAEIAFEADDEQKAYPVDDKIVWSSPPERHDAAILRLKTAAPHIDPLPMAKRLPLVEKSATVYIIGHPGGRDLAFSCQDNELLDHEGPPAGKMQIPGVCRVHYRAPTEGGSSGSPVFNADLWEVIALHHKGGKTNMPKLNGAPGTYGANEGISIESIRGAVKDERAKGAGP
jgi:hypothetical protein